MSETKTNKHLSFSKRLQITDFLRQQGDKIKGKEAPEMTKIIKDGLGFDLSESTLRNLCRAAQIPIKRSKGGTFLATMKDVMKSQAECIDMLCKQLNVTPPDHFRATTERLRAFVFSENHE